MSLVEKNTIEMPPPTAVRKIKVKIKKDNEGQIEKNCESSKEITTPPTDSMQNTFTLTDHLEVTKNITAADNISSAIREVKETQEKNKRKIQQGAIPEFCTECREILPNFMIPHLPTSCPVRNSLYCGFCSRYGHTSKTCDVAPPPWAKNVTYVEQLIPSDTLKQYKIKTKTPLCSSIPSTIPGINEKIPNGPETIELRDNDKLIKAWLRARGVPATENHRKNKELLQQFADRHGRVLVYLP